ncbi:MAG: hypothetical protein P8015_00005, partial [Acidihalobacter sp.]
AGVVQIFQGVDAKEHGDAIFGVGSIILGISWSIFSVVLLMTSWITLGVGLVITLILVAIGFVISLFRHDKLQHWLDSCYFGKHELGSEKFTNLHQQTTALAAFAKEH